MKRFLCGLLAACMLVCALSGCSNPNSLQMDLSQGYGQQIKLIHLNASASEKRERMEAFAQALADSKPLEKDLSMFAYYPDYRLELSGKALTAAADQSGSGFTVVDVPSGSGATLTAIVDINGDFVDFYFPGPAPEQSETIYRSAMAADDFKKLVHHA